MEELQMKLMGALIGLARATDGNEHLISQSSTALVIDALSAVQADEDTLQTLLVRASDEKRKMVPDCFLCANPCGRTSDFDLKELRHADEEVRTVKLQLLSAIRHLAGKNTGYDTGLLYKALVVIGMEDYTAEDLHPILQEIEAATK